MKGLDAHTNKTLTAIFCDDQVFHRHLAANLMCPLCDAEPETIEHCLLLCPLVSQDDHCDFGADFETIVSFLLWNIWKARCNLVFNKAAFDPVQTASTAFRLAQEFLLIPQNLYKSLASPISNPDGVVQHWINPKLGMIKINTDAAWNKDSAECGLAAVAQNSLGKIVGGMHNYGSAISVMAADALAIKLGLSLASSLSLSSFQSESDSLVLISTLSNPLSTVDWTADR
ncbi:hypothetical protein ACLB2K_031705 [Fragaria x ananassa]